MPDDPTIRFFDGPTGHRVAYATQGSGPPLVCSAWWVSHLEEDWKQAGFRRFFGGLAEHFTVVRYDRPGSGLSDRERQRVELDDETSTLTALVDHLALDTVSLFGLSCAGPPAIALAAAQPERIDKLVLFGSYVRGSDVAPTPIQEAVTQMVQAHWGMGAKMITDLFDPGLDADEREAMSKIQRMAASKDMAASLLSLTFSSHVASQAAAVGTPTLVLHRKGDRAIPFSAGRELAATLPNASFVPLDGDEHVPWRGDVGDALSRVLGFFDRRGPGAEVSTSAYVLARAGDVWTLTFGTQTVHLKHARGLSDLAVLLSNAGEEIHVGTLWSGAATAAELGQTEDPILDDAALNAYRKRLREIEAALIDAEGGHAKKLREEEAALTAELRSAVGLGGRQRNLDATSERARKAVTARLRASIQKIAEVSPAAGAHLNKAVMTGVFCRYEPPDGVIWEVR